MRRRQTTLEELEEFHDSLQGPLGRALRDAGIIMNQRLQARGLELSDLSDKEMVQLLTTAFREAAPKHYPHVDRVTLEPRLDAMVAAIGMELAATADSSEAMNKPGFGNERSKALGRYQAHGGLQIVLEKWGG